MITPKEAFDAIKVLWPDVQAIQRIANRPRAVRVHRPSDYPYDREFLAEVDWAYTSEYPVPKKKWRDAKPEDVCYPFKKARFRDCDIHCWTTGVLCGYAAPSSAKWIYTNGEAFYQCQVEDK